MVKKRLIKGVPGEAGHVALQVNSGGGLQVDGCDGDSDDDHDGGSDDDCGDSDDDTVKKRLIKGIPGREKHVAGEAGAA